MTDIFSITKELDGSQRVDNSLRLLALEENWILCAIIIAVNAIWHSGMLLSVRNILTVLRMLTLYIRVQRARFISLGRYNPVHSPPLSFFFVSHLALSLVFEKAKMCKPISNFEKFKKTL